MLFFRNLSSRWYCFFNRSIPNAVLRFCVMLVGMLLLAFGIALSRATGLGTSAISCVPATLSYISPLSMGLFTFILNMIFLAVQAVLLRRDFNIVQLLQIPVVLIFSTAIDVLVGPCEALPMQSYPAQILFMVFSCIVSSLGLFFQVQAAFIMIPCDGTVLTLSRVFGFDLSKVKITFDTTMVVCACILSLVFLSGLYGVREGTIISMVVTGPTIKAWSRLFKNFERFVPTKGHITFIPQEKSR